MSASEDSEESAISRLSTVTHESIQQFVTDHFEAIVAAICTEDGFVISQASSSTCSVESDKMASISSTLLSMCSAAVQNIKAGDLRHAIIDSESANLIFCNTTVFGRSVVLTVAMSQSISLGQTLFLVNRLKKEIESASLLPGNDGEQ